MVTKNTGWEFAYGCFGGFVGQSLCHPFDTIKTRQQDNVNYKIKTDFQKNGWKTFYRGLPSPLASVILEKSVLFSSYHIFRNNQQYNFGSFTSGILAGLMTTITVTPFERIKVKTQLDIPNNQRLKRNTFNILLQVVKTDGFLSLYRGWTAMLFREVPGYGIYFSTYDLVKQHLSNHNNLKPWQAFLTGSLAGVSAWIFIMPSDPIKTIMQRDNVGGIHAINMIWKESGIKGFYRGYKACLIRAGILHGGVFMGYETAKSFLEV